MKFHLMNKTGVESKGCKEVSSSIKEHRNLKGIKTIIKKFLVAYFAKK